MWTDVFLFQTDNKAKKHSWHVNFNILLTCLCFIFFFCDDIQDLNTSKLFWNSKRSRSLLNKTLLKTYLHALLSQISAGSVVKLNNY